ncbi:MAG TPA: PAS domain S-box protein, partial [Isosphaeraceae bacterium]
AEEPILSMIGGGRPLPEVLDALCRMIEALCAGATCSVLLLDADGKNLRWAAAPGLPRAYRDAVEADPVGPGCGSCGTAAHAGEVVVVEVIAADPLWERGREGPLGVGLRACWSVPIRSSAGGVLGTFGTFLPEPRRPAAHELRLCRRVAHLAAGAIERARSESRYRRIVETANEGIWTLDADQRTTFVNARMAEMLGDSVAELIGRSAWDFAFEEDRPEGRRRWERLQAGEAGRSEVRLRRRDGSGLWVHSSTGPIHDSDGRFAGALGMFADITGRKEAEEALKESERRFRQMAETIREVFWMTDPGKGQLLYVSPAYEEVWGRPCRSLYEQPFSFFEAIHPEDRERVRAASLERQNRGDPSDVEYRVVRPDGSVRWVRDRSFPVRDESGTVDRVAGLAEDITERKLAGDALRRSEARLRRVVESNVVGLIVADFSGRVLEANDAFLRLTGSSRDQLRSGRLNFLELTPPEHRHLDRRAMEEMRDTGRHAPFEKEYIRKDGSRVPVLVGTSFLGRDRDGGELGVGFIVDLTERKRAEAALRDSEERFRGLMEQAPFSVQVFSPDGRVVRANRAWEELWGVTADRIPEYNILADPQLEAKGVLPLIRRAFLGETVQIPAIRYDPEETLPGRTRHDDPVRWVSAVAYPLKDKDGRVREVVAVHEDMTAWMRAEEALRESESTLRAFYDHSPVCLGVTEPTGDGDVLHVYDNPATCRVFGIEPGTTAGKRALADLGGDPAVVAGWLDCYQRSAATGQPVHFDHEYPTPNGTRWLSATVCPIGPGPSGRPRFCYVAEDVTERRRAEAAVRASEERLRLALGAGRMGTWDWDLSSGCVAWSDNLEEVHGLPPGGFDCTLEGFHRLVHPEDRQRVEAAIRRAIELVSGYEVEFRIVRPDGSAGWMLGLGKVFTDEAGCPARMIGVGMDITLRKQDEERLRASEANAALALGVARLGTWGWDLAGGGVDADARCREICGFDLDATLTLTEVRAAVLPQDWPRVEAALGEALRPGGDGGYAGEFRFAHADESVRWVVSHGRTLFEGQGAARRPVRMVGTVLDITGRKRAEEALREADRRKDEFL